MRMGLTSDVVLKVATLETLGWVVPDATDQALSGTRPKHVSGTYRIAGNIGSI